MSHLDNDPWIEANLIALDPKRVHAVGVVTLRWNVCEFALFALFSEVVKLPEAECWTIVHQLGDVAISERIKALMFHRQFHADNKEFVINALDAYDACRQNRNSIAHSWIRTVSNDLVLARRGKRIDRMDAEPFPSGLAEVRRVAEELHKLIDHLFLIHWMLETHDRTQPIPWPDKLQMPELLWKPPPQVPKAPKRPPQSSPV